MAAWSLSRSVGSARYYDPQLGKWHSVDPADEFNSPYVYVGNRPIITVDPDGADSEVRVTGEGQKATGYKNPNSTNVNILGYFFNTKKEACNFFGISKYKLNKNIREEKQ